MELTISDKLDKVWDLWDIRACVLLSLFLQVLLAAFAPCRQQSSSTFVVMVIWSAYLAANWVASFTVGLISKALANPNNRSNHENIQGNEQLYAFWAAFLLLHLGGPDSITSFSLEDNELWLRQMFGLVLQSAGACYCLYLTLPITTTTATTDLVRLSTIFVLVVGCIKYAERTVALYLGSLGRLGDDTVEAPDVSTGFDFNFAAPSSEPDHHAGLLAASRSLFEGFKGVLAGLAPTPKAIESSRKLFHRVRTDAPNVGFRLIEYELSLMYEVLHTKVVVVRNTIGCVFRLSSLCFISAALVLFHYGVIGNRRNEFGGFEVSLSYALIIGALVVDTFCGIKLIFSDWILVSDTMLFIKGWRKYLPQYVWKRKRWSGSIPQYNIVDYCLNERWIWNCNVPVNVRGIVLDNIKVGLFSSSKDDIEDLKCFIFEKLVIMSTQEQSGSSNYTVGGTNIKNDFAYYSSVLELHLATEFCYHCQTEKNQEEELVENNPHMLNEERARKMCKLISDYIFYLLVMQPQMFTLELMKKEWKKRVWDTFAAAKRCSMEFQIASSSEENQRVLRSRESSGASKLLLSWHLSDPDAEIWNLLRRLPEEERKWDQMAVAWVEKLCTGAMKCRPTFHAQQTSRGGELLTFVWLLVHHLGLAPPQTSAPPPPPAPAQASASEDTNSTAQPP